MNGLLVNMHFMVGCDFHTEPAPPPIPPIPTMPHFVYAPLYFLMLPSMAQNVQCCWGSFYVMKRGTDITSGIPHCPIPPVPNNLLVPVYMAFSASKSHFGVATVQVDGAPVAVANFVYVNTNLNCGDIPTITNLVIAYNTVVSAMTNADSWGGCFSLLVDFAIQAALSRLIGGFGINGWGEGLLGALVGTPLGFGFNSTGTGIVGGVGRFTSAFNDWARGWGESLGGDSKTGQATRDAAWNTMGDILMRGMMGAGVVAFSPILAPPIIAADGVAGWDAQHDVDVIYARPKETLNALDSWLSSPSSDSGAGSGTGPSSTSSAFDNPNAEQF